MYTHHSRHMCVCGPQTFGSVPVVVEAVASVGQLDEEELEVDVDLDDLRAITARTTAAEGSVDLRQLIRIKRCTKGERP